ncbi:hypothetical protein [Flavobacterium sp.]|uniref:hypothetical protein n=1 Tax=Flavobacterium sp. TaxID=239 RepID=UPI00286B18C3|nr:hypothetical protein [Flavobacterium sp.]
MKKHIPLLVSLFLVQFIAVAQSSWKSPEYKPEVYRKVMVLVKTTDELIKRQVEDATVALFKEKGIEAIQAYSNIVESDLTSEDALIQKADVLGVDALLVYNIVGNDTAFKNTPLINASVGIPVRVGIFGGFLGTNVPIAGGAKTVKTIKVTASFYNRSSKSMQWSIPLSGKLKGDNSKLANTFAKKTVSAMINDNLFSL